MEVNPLVFETSASTNSAIWALSFDCSAKVLLSFEVANVWGIIFRKRVNYFTIVYFYAVFDALVALDDSSY